MEPIICGDRVIALIEGLAAPGEVVGVGYALGDRIEVQLDDGRVATLKRDQLTTPARAMAQFQRPPSRPPSFLEEVLAVGASSQEVA